MEKLGGVRIPSLDGLRAFSIAFVLLGHLRGTRHFPNAIFPAGLAEFGVRVFFVISGFLITTLLLSEWRRTSTISIRDFYVRRVYRIFPAFYAFMAVILALTVMGVIQLGRGDAVAAATYTMNYHRPRAWWVGHLWSLAVEEQFYLLWPLLLRLVTPARGVWIAVSAVLAAPLARLGTWVFLPGARAGIDEAFPTVCDAIAIGCLLACVRDRLGEAPRYLAFLRSPWLLPLLPLALVAAVLLRDQVFLNYAFFQSFANVVIALSIDRWVRYPDGPFGRVLNSRPAVFVGVLSYSLYLWQQLFLNRSSSAAVHAFPLNVLLAFAAALASYYLVERTFLRLRARRPARAPVAVAPVPAG
jgi:peptidoglycan/LPS O-acetylase OafA/YrhL